MRPDEQQILGQFAGIGVGEIISGLLLLILGIVTYVMKEDRARIRELEKSVAAIIGDDDDTQIFKELGKQEMVNDKQWDILGDLEKKVAVLEAKLTRSKSV